MGWKILIFLCGMIALGRSGNMCSKDAKMSDLPEGLAKEVISMATTGIISSFAGCSDEYKVDPAKVGFWLWNKDHKDEPVRLDNSSLSLLNPQEKTMMVIHGWACNVTGDGFPEMKDAYLTKYPNANIISIDWAVYAIDLYAHSFCYVPEVANLVGRFICDMRSSPGVNVSSLHLIGHSLGAHMSGLAGQETKKLCRKTIGRITGLDPSGPLYQTLSKSKRLDAGDATIVDVIHTNQAQFGYYGSCGTVDFFPNCGYYQPGCLLESLSMDLSSLINLPLSVVNCNHRRSIDYFNESILSPDGFKARSCRTCSGLPPLGLCVPDVIKKSSSVMGEDYPKHPGTASKYYLTTNSESPFAKS